METMKKWLIASFVLTLCLMVLSSVCLFRMHTLSEQLFYMEEQNRELGEKCRDLSGYVTCMQSELDEMERKAKSKLEDMTYTVTGAGTQPGTVEYRFTLTPKELTEDMILELTVGDLTVPLTEEGGRFTGTVDVPLFEDDLPDPTVNITSNGTTRTEELEEVDLYYAYRYWLPELFISMSGTESSADSDTKVTLAYGFRPRAQYAKTPVTFTRMILIQKVNGEQVSSQDVTNRLRDDGAQNFTEIYADFQMDHEDYMQIFLRAWDSEGYVHEIETRCQYDRELECVDVSSGEEQIYASDGAALYSSPFDHYF